MASPSHFYGGVMPTKKQKNRKKRAPREPSVPFVFMPIALLLMADFALRSGSHFLWVPMGIATVLTTWIFYRETFRTPKKSANPL